MKLPDISSILFLGTDDVVALPAIRAIGTALPRTSLHTLSNDTDNVHISNYSKYVRSHHTLEHSEGVELLDELIFRIKDCEAEILLPIDEDSVRFVSMNSDALKNHVKLPPLSPVDLLDSLISKDRLAKLLKAKGFQSPETHPVKNLDYSILSKEFFPCLMKPIRGSGGRNFIKIKDIADLEKLLDNEKYEDFILQKMIPGSDIGCNILAVDGEVKAHTIQRGIIKEAYSFSKGIRFENNKILFAQVEQFIRDIGFSGIANLDYRFDDSDRQPKLIDFNARYWSNLEGSKAAGIDFTLLNCLEALKYPYEKPAFKNCNYLLGRAVLSRFSSSNGSIPTFTDLKSRISDPLPELLRVFKK